VPSGAKICCGWFCVPAELDASIGPSVAALAATVSGTAVMSRPLSGTFAALESGTATAFVPVSGPIAFPSREGAARVAVAEIGSGAGAIGTGTGTEAGGIGGVAAAAVAPPAVVDAVADFALDDDAESEDDEIHEGREAIPRRAVTPAHLPVATAESAIFGCVSAFAG